MSWLDDLLQARRQSPTQPAQAVAPFPDGERPSWAGATGLYWTIGEKDLGALSDDPAPAPTLASESAPLPKRAPIWRTRQGDEVTIGDLVALSVLGADGRDAKGRIVASAGVDAVECVLGDVADDGKRPRLRVDMNNLLLLLRRA